MKWAVNYFFPSYVSGCNNMKVQNALLTKFMIMKLAIDAFSISIFLSALTKNLCLNFFVQQPVDKLL